MEESQNHLREEDEGQDGVMGWKSGTNGDRRNTSSVEMFGVLRMQILMAREKAQWSSVQFLQRTCLVSSI